MNRLLLLIPLFFSSIVSANTFFVSPTGKDSNLGTITAPWATFQKAITMAYPGDTVYFRGGTYYPRETITIDLGNSPNIGRSGTPGNPICYFNYPGETVIFDLINIKPAPSNWSAGISVSYADFIFMRGFEVKNLFQYREEVMVEAVQNYMCSNIQYENFKVHHNSGVGFKYTGAAGVDGYDPPVYRYPYDTIRFINCDAYHNCDSLVIQGNLLGNRADGFKVQNQNYTYVYFEGCRAWNNSDDGFDPSGDAFRDFLNCWSFNNGYLEGDGYGWKMSGPGIDVSTMTLQLKRCIAANNTAWGFGEVDQPGYYKNVANYFNNIAYHNEYGFGNDWRDIESPVIDRDNIYRNNISYDNQNSGYDPDVQLYNYIHDHNSWDSDVTVSNTDFITLDVAQLERPRKSDGSLPDVDFMKLVSGSDLIDAGIAVGLPFSGTAPDLGCFEFSSGSVTVPIPVYVNSVVENTTPSRLEMTYSLALAGIIPATSAFTVTVNSSTRNVLSVSISGYKVYLTLASPVVYGDAITVAYTKPSTSPLQTSAGGQAASISARNVVNNVVAANPVYVSAVIQNASPSRLEMTYSLALAGIIPATSAFTVTVNSSTRNVTSVSISGYKVYLTLASPVVYGDAVTVAYTKPSTNPLQTPDGGQAASIISQSVINNCSLVANQPPVIAITSPTKSITFVAPATITIEAVASDPDGSISKVEFYNGQTKLGESTVSPISFIWKEVPEGTYTLTAVAIDNLNSRTVSAPVDIIVEKSTEAVNQKPILSILKPGKKEKHKKNDTIVIEAEASDPDGSISKVEFKSGSTTLAEVTSAPYIFVWENVDTGTYILTAIATDNLGATTTSAEIELNVIEFYDENSGIINLYPNPNDGNFAIDIYSELPERNHRVTIANISGEIVFSKILMQQENYMEFDLSNQTAGSYILMITNGSDILATKKFIKKQ